MTLAEVEKYFVDQLITLYPAEECKYLAWLTVNYVCKIDRATFLLQKQNSLSDDQQRNIYKILDELKTAKPLQYILGETVFYGLTYKVSSSVLIPRPETEELVDWILKTVKEIAKTESALNIIDIGTGSGCIPITLKKHLLHASVVGVDVSALALEVANQNALLNKVAVKFISDDILNSSSEINRTVYDIVVSNPPYVRASEAKLMHANVINYEPQIALFVSDEDPLLFYKQIADFALSHLKDGGYLFFEINEGLGLEMIDLLTTRGFRTVELRKDLRGKDRMIKAQK